MSEPAHQGGFVAFTTPTGPVSCFYDRWRADVDPAAWMAELECGWEAEAYEQEMLRDEQDRMLLAEIESRGMVFDDPNFDDGVDR